MNEITITLEDKEYQIDVQKARELGVLKEKDPRCKSWEEFFKKYDTKKGYYFNSSDKKLIEIRSPRGTSEQLTCEEAIAISAFAKLIKLRRDWIGDWDPDWTKSVGDRKYGIELYKNEFYVESFSQYSKAFTFPTKEMAIEFLECFRSLFEQCKYLI